MRYSGNSRLLDVQSNDYAIGTKLSSPYRVSGDNQQLTPAHQPPQLEQERDLLYGSELIRESLAALPTPGKWSSTMTRVLNINF